MVGKSQATSAEDKPLFWELDVVGFPAVGESG